MAGNPWFWIAAFFAGTTLAGVALWAWERGRRGLKERYLEELQEVQQRLEGELARHVRSGEKRAEELADARRRLERAKKRVLDVQAAEEGWRQERRKLESRLELRETELREGRERLERVEAELRLGERRAAEQRAELERARAATADRSRQRDRTREGTDADAERSRIRELEKRVREAEGEARRYRTRERTHRRLYDVIKGELDVMKDRVRALERGRDDGSSLPEPGRPGPDATEEPASES